MDTTQGMPLGFSNRIVAGPFYQFKCSDHVFQQNLQFLLQCRKANSPQLLLFFLFAAIQKCHRDIVNRNVVRFMVLFGYTAVKDQQNYESLGTKFET